MYHVLSTIWISGAQISCKSGVCRLYKQSRGIEGKEGGNRGEGDDEIDAWMRRN